ncbi:hypothetical protein JCM10908_000627 [Rhodotorula pacifica]|uniref:autophagy protein 5 n=1 Tax=Rhodotorula pacifica TaxID=1495444 RepID=UPI0031803070
MRASPTSRPPPPPPTAAESSAAASFRSLVFRGTVPLQVELASDDWPAGSVDRTVECYYIQAPRITYLPLLLEEVKRNFVDLVALNSSAACLSSTDIWFETVPTDGSAAAGVPLRWHWPLGLLYDLHYTSHQLSLLPPRPVAIPPALASVFAPFESGGPSSGPARGREAEAADLSLSVDGGSRGGNAGSGRMASSTSTLRPSSTSSSSTKGGALAGGSRQRTKSNLSAASTTSSAATTTTASVGMNRTASSSSTSSSSAASAATGGSNFRQSTILNPAAGSTTSSFGPGPGGGNISPATQPWRIRLRVRDRSNTGASTAAKQAETVGVLNGSGTGGGGGTGQTVEEVRTGFMALIKEADYVRWGSTKRVMNLRKEQQDNLWDAVVQHDFEKYWQVASKLVPLPAPPSSASSASTTSAPSSSRITSTPPPPSASPTGGEGRLPDANGVKHVPLRVYLPASSAGATEVTGSGAGMVTVVQELVAPLRRDGTPTTLRQALSQLVPLLFPPQPTSTSSSAAAASPPPLAYPLIHGIYPPFETEVGWLGACMAGTDGWVSVVVVLDER